MSKEEIKQIIQNNIHFKSLEESDIDFLIKHSSFISYNENDFIFNFRDKAQNFYLIVEGKVSLQMFSHEKGGIILEEISSGELLGWSWMKSPFTWKFDSFSLTKTKLIMFDAEAIKSKMIKNPAFGYKVQNIFVNIIIDRMQATRLRLLKELGDNIYIPE